MRHKINTILISILILQDFPCCVEMLFLITHHKQILKCLNLK